MFFVPAVRNSLSVHPRTFLIKGRLVHYFIYQSCFSEQNTVCLSFNISVFAVFVKTESQLLLT